MGVVALWAKLLKAGDLAETGASSLDLSSPLMPEKMKDQREELEVKSQLPTIA
jgi:hypothetical protein